MTYCKIILTACLLIPHFLLPLDSFSQGQTPEIGRFTLEKAEKNGGDFIELRLFSQENEHINIDMPMTFRVDGDTVTLASNHGIAKGDYQNFNEVFFAEVISASGTTYGLFRKNESETPKRIPLWWSIFPPLIAIGLALVFKEVIPALFGGIWLGAWVLSGFSVIGLLTSLFTVVDTFLIDALANADHMAIIVFSVLIGAMVQVMLKSGGMTGVVNKLSILAKTARRTQLVTWLMGIVIFFDDYANTLVVGSTMRPLTDRFKISRAKLAYIVDSTAAPVAAIALITTWIGAELGYIQDALDAISAQKGIKAIAFSSYELFIMSLQYAFYPVFTLFFIFLMIVTQREFGPMLKAERKARAAETKETEIVQKKGNWLNAIIPVLALVGVTFFKIIQTGVSGSEGLAGLGVIEKLRIVVGNSNSYVALLWGSFAGLSTALILAGITKALSVAKSMEAVMDGVKTMMGAVVILVLAWALAATTSHLHTADFLISIMPGWVNPFMLPAMLFVLAALIAFSTGSSWGTMAILYAISIPVVWTQVCATEGISDAQGIAILVHSISVILAGAVLGDHCSPISDTTILSSLATDCNHVEHVRTQLPYALTIGGISILCSGVLFSLGVPWWLIYLLGFAMVVAVVRFVGKPVERTRIVTDAN